MTTTAATMASRCFRNRHHISCHWLATETRSSAASLASRPVVTGPGAAMTSSIAMFQFPVVSGRLAASGRSLLALQSDARVDPEQHEIRDQRADDGHHAEQQN